MTCRPRALAVAWGDWATGYFHYWTWPFAKVPEVSPSSHIHYLYLRGVKIELIFALQAAVFENGPSFKIVICGHETWPLTKVPEVAHIVFFYRNLAYFALRAAVSEIQANFQNCHIWAWNLASGQSYRSCTYTLYLVYPRGWKLSLFSLYGQQFARYGPIFKIAIFALHETCHWPNFQKLHTYSLSTPGHRNWAYFRSTGSNFRDTGQLLKLPYFGMKLGKCSMFPKLHIYHVYSLSTPGFEIGIIFALRAAVSETQADFQHCHIWAWNLAISESSTIFTYTLFLPQRGVISMFCNISAQQDFSSLW